VKDIYLPRGLEKNTKLLAFIIIQRTELDLDKAIAFPVMMLLTGMSLFLLIFC
jgi:ABC-type sulfate transport system permease component